MSRTKVYPYLQLHRLVATLFLCLPLAGQAQPYDYWAEEIGEDEYYRPLHTIKVYDYNTDAVHVVLDTTYGLVQYGLSVSPDQTRLFLNHSFRHANILGVAEIGPGGTISDVIAVFEGDNGQMGGEYVDHVLDAPKSQRLYVFTTLTESPHETDSTSEEYRESQVHVFDRMTYEPYQSIKVVPEGYTYDWHSWKDFYAPFLSEDESQIFMLLPVKEGILFHVVDAASGAVLDDRRPCGNVGPLPAAPRVLDHHAGRALLAYEASGQTQLAVCDPVRGLLFPSFTSPSLGPAFLSGDGHFAVLARWRIKERLNGYSAYNHGDIFIMDAENGLLQQRLSVPPKYQMHISEVHPETLFLSYTRSAPLRVETGETTPMEALLDAFRAEIDTAAANGSVNDPALLSQLDTDLENAASALARTDSLSVARHLQRFQKHLEAAYQNSDGRRLTEDAHLILSFYAHHILARLPEPPTISIPELPAALTVASPAASASFDGNAFHISADHAHGMLTLTEAARESLVAALNRNQQTNISGIGAAPDIVRAALDFDPAVAIDKLLAFVTDTLRTSPEALPGTEEAPAIAYAPEGLKLAGKSSGTGVLIVDGTLSLQGAAQWRGLVIVRAAGKTPPSLTLRGKATITGGILIYNDQPQAARLDVAGHATVRYSRTALDLLRTALSATP